MTKTLQKTPVNKTSKSLYIQLGDIRASVLRNDEADNYDLAPERDYLIVALEKDSLDFVRGAFAEDRVSHFGVQVILGANSGFIWVPVIIKNDASFLWTSVHPLIGDDKILKYSFDYILLDIWLQSPLDLAVQLREEHSNNMDIVFCRDQEGFLAGRREKSFLKSAPVLYSVH